jgi:NADH-quinone oxidoreductase subunit N
MFRSVMIAGGAATVALAVIAAINTVIALYYYAKVVKSVWLDDPVAEFADDDDERPAGSLRLALGITVVLTVIIGFFPALATFAGEAARVIASGS